MEGLDDKQLVSMAKYAEQADRYDDMVKFMKEFTIRKKNLTVDERNLLSVAYKNVVGAKRSAVRIIMSIEAKEEGKGKEHIKDYKDSIKKKVMDICFEMLELIEQHLLPNIEGSECEKTDATVFYQKMKGDYFRYLVEVSGDDDTEKHKESSKKAYEDATESASGLASTHPIKLGLALNCSVFYYEIMNNPEKACDLAKQAFDAAIADLDSLKDDSYKDSTLIMQLLRDNLTLWTSEKQDDNADE